MYAVYSIGDLDQVFPELFDLILKDRRIHFRKILVKVVFAVFEKDVVRGLDQIFLGSSIRDSRLASGPHILLVLVFTEASDHPFMSSKSTEGFHFVLKHPAAAIAALEGF
jgi:hypothetical protein